MVSDGEGGTVSRYLTNLAERALGRIDPVQPRLPSRFEPPATAAAPPADPVDAEVPEAAITARDDVGGRRRGVLLDDEDQASTHPDVEARPTQPADRASFAPAGRPPVGPPDISRSGLRAPKFGASVGSSASASPAGAPERWEPARGAQPDDPRPRRAPRPAERPAAVEPDVSRAAEPPSATAPIDDRRKAPRDNAADVPESEHRTRDGPERATPRPGQWTDAVRAEVRRLLEPGPRADRGSPPGFERSPPDSPPVTSSPPRARPPRADDSRPRNGAPTVRVTIGRIEVRAVTAEPPRPSPPRTPPPRMSLEEYLRGQRERTGR